jgi:DNA-binding MarR family transcriptional regulator
MANDRDERAVREKGRLDRTGGPSDSSDARRAGPRSFAPYRPGIDPATAWDQFGEFGKRPPPGEPSEETFYQMARATVKSRKLRSRVLPNSMFGEPAWDMLLALYVVDRRGARETISKLCLSSGAPSTTALRWLDYLEQQKLVARRQSSTDRRVVFVDLTDSGREAVETYFAELYREGLASPGAR